MRTFIGNYLLNRKLKQHQREQQFQGLQQSVTVGIVFDASASSDNVIVKNLVKELRQMGKEIKVLGYVNHRKKDAQYISDHQNIYISKQDFNWINQPKEAMIDEFIYKKFDILLVLTHQNWFPIHYVSALSQAHFKVGQSLLPQKFYDLIIELPENTSLEEQARQMMSYLKIISQ
ncbi:hypothetical protein LX69_02644 [Breznakibacter xylanolyticus]|uniref:Uncharacterized protein n=1 Tax=Breznakibacter xylanolyticus TaxID=990 RepID=A0A2W7N187_9BACT|nr:hypothetical protein [Breznakibacter xylanolyticus]MBN2743320.1 hypothetical protein [Marinilabiliaceae bacterium]PZX13533.1 hypothetical protein LX69_02644 [Breznakibacter xylanolyticus]